MEEVVNMIMDLVGKIVELVSAGDKEKERQAMLAIASRAADEAAKRALGI